MKYMKQFLIIAAICFVAEFIKSKIALPIPASIIGLLILLILLQSKILRVDQIRECAMFLIEIMPLMFIAPAAGLMKVWPNLSPVVLPYAFITLTSTVLVMVVSGKLTQWIKGSDKS